MRGGREEEGVGGREGGEEGKITKCIELDVCGTVSKANKESNKCESEEISL